MRFFLFFIFWIAIIPLNAQDLHHSIILNDEGYCASDFLHAKMLKASKEYATKTIESNHDNYLAQTLGLNAKQSSATVYTIPVVVHIIHNNGAENISDQQVIDGIKHLNDAFKHLSPFNGTQGVDVGIEFCLSKQDPFGNSSTGINRIVSTLTNLDYQTKDLDLKNLSRWDPNHYLNIWLVNEICTSSDCGVAGYAYLAAAHGQAIDGIVNEARWFGSSADKSKVHIHEVGHYLNLFHTFQGGCKNTNCLLDGDQVCDTPPDQSTSYTSPCSSIVNSCTTDADDLSTLNPFRPIANGGLGDQDDMFQNYMDYGNQQCQNTFTNGQKSRMISALTGIRKSLLNSKGCQNPCTSNVTAGFSPSSNAINAGNTINFANTSTGALFFQWKLNGSIFSTTSNSSYLFNSIGTYKVWLVASNNDGNCTDSISTTIVVNCPSLASFTTNNTNPSTGQNVAFSNTSTGSNTYEWKINTTAFSVGTNTTYQFNTTGKYVIELIATNSAYNCISSFKDTVNVRCSAQAHFSCSSTIDVVGATIAFTNTSVLSNSYQWLINGTLHSTAINTSYTFGDTELGNNSVQLISSDGNCYDTLSQTIRIKALCTASNKEANIWYFGQNAGIDFNSGAPVALTDGMINTREGVSAISDANGNLLFYSEGISVWDKNHTVMPNGNGLMGDPSSTQSGVILQKPGSTSRYYIFTANGAANGYLYSEVDMTLNGGLGDIVLSSKNTLLLNNATEKLTATRHANGIDIWVVMHEVNNSVFRAYLLTASGVAAVPITSSVGSVVNKVGDWNAAGYIKFKPDGSQLINPFNGSKYIAELFDFDNSTGVLTGPVVVFNSLSGAYGVEFSANGNILYISEMLRSPTYGAGYNNKGAVAQYNLLAGDNAAINASRTVLTSSPTIGYGALQIAPDGKIYVAKENVYNVGMPYLDVIDNPNALGSSCDYQDNGFYLGGKETLVGLPNFVYAQYTTPTFTVAGDDEVCISEEKTYNINMSVAAGTNWSTTGNIAVVSKSNSSITLKFKQPGVVKLNVNSTDCSANVSDSMEINVFEPPLIELGINDSLCSDEFPYALDAGIANSYLWKDNSTNQTFSAVNAGEYWIKVTSDKGCSAYDTITLTDKGARAVVDLNNAEICKSRTMLFDAGAGYNYLWQDGSTNQTYSAFLPGKYWVSVTNACNTTSDTAYLSVLPLPAITFAVTDPIICIGAAPVALSGSPSGGIFSGTGIQNNTFTPQYAELGKNTITYTYTAPNNCMGSNSQNIIVEKGGALIFKDTAVCEASSILLNPGNYKQYTWQDGSTNKTYNVTQSGTYSVDAEDADGCISTITTTVHWNDDCFFIPNLVTTNNDGHNDYFFVRGIDDSYTLEIFNRWDALVYKKENYDNSFNGEGVVDGVYFYYLYSEKHDKHYKGWVHIIGK